MTLSSRVVFQSFSKSLVHLDLCLVGNHFCYISDLSQFTNSFCCAICSQCFTNKYRLQRHKVQCAKSSSRLKFGNGIFHPPKNIFERIESITGIDVPQEYRFYPYRATFDIESYLPKCKDKSTPKLTFNTDHILTSISVCSNIPAAEILVKKIESFISDLKRMRDQRLSVEQQYRQKPWSNPHTYAAKSWDSIIDQVMAHFHELPVISFNGQRYDINVIRTPLIRHLSKHDEILFSIKRNNALKCIKTKSLKFLDITNYIAPLGSTIRRLSKHTTVKWKRLCFPMNILTH